MDSFSAADTGTSLTTLEVATFNSHSHEIRDCMIGNFPSTQNISRSRSLSILLARERKTPIGSDPFYIDERVGINAFMISYLLIRKRISFPTFSVDTEYGIKPLS